MLSRITKTSSVTIMFCIFSVLIFLEASAAADPMSICPDKIILNAECVGASQDIQAIFFGVPLDIYHRINNLNAEFYFVVEGEEKLVEETSSFHYCWDDDNLLISFNRSAIQEYAKANGMTDGTWEVIVKCTFDVVDLDGYLIETRSLEGADQVEILSPGNKK